MNTFRRCRGSEKELGAAEVLNTMLHDRDVVVAQTNMVGTVIWYTLRLIILPGMFPGTIHPHSMNPDSA